MKATGIVRRTLRIRERDPLKMTWTQFDGYIWAMGNLNKRLR